MAFDKQLLRRKIEEAGISQVELAKSVSVTPRTVNRWLNGDKPPKRSKIEELAVELHCSPEDFDPRHADGENSIRVEARVSAASHNAFAAMNVVYGVDEQTIIELAPALFSLVAARAVAIPGEDDRWWAEVSSQAERYGYPSFQQFGNAEDVAARDLDHRAARNSACFGLPQDEHNWIPSRNLFVEAMRRIASEAGGTVNMDQFVTSATGEAPLATGFNPHVSLYEKVADGDAEIVRRLAMGDIRLSLSVVRAHRKANGNIDDWAEIIRKDLADQAAAQRAKLADARRDSLSQLETWRAFYQEHHPELASEYETFVAAYCKPEGWYPDYYDAEARELDFARPFAETRFIDNEKLASQQKASAKGVLWLSFNAPEIKRFKELQKHRRQSKAEFVEQGQ